MTDMSSLFVESSFNEDISSWDTSNVTDMSSMFGAATNFNQDIGGWDTVNVTNMDYMFYGTDAFNQDLSSWTVDFVTSCEDFAFNATGGLTPPNFTACTP